MFVVRIQQSQKMTANRLAVHLDVIVCIQPLPDRILGKLMFLIRILFQDLQNILLNRFSW